VVYKEIEIQLAKVFMDRRDIAKRIVDSEIALKQFLEKEAEDKKAVEDYQSKLGLLGNDQLVYIASYRIVKGSLVDKKAAYKVSRVAVALEKQNLEQLKKLAEQLEVQHKSLENLAANALNNISRIMECGC
jgi:hypothetical protein